MVLMLVNLQNPAWFFCFFNPQTIIQVRGELILVSSSVSAVEKQEFLSTL